MQLPFTAEEFLDLFERYNQAIWPMQIVAYLLGLAAVVLAIWKVPNSHRAISAILGVFWLWVGVVFLAWYYRAINGTVAVGFGMLLALQGLFFIYSGAIQGKMHFSAGPQWGKLTGALFMIYALIIYPVLGALMGHGYPLSPLFGVAPCPTTIFTFGILLWTDGKLPRYLLVIPFIWSVFGVGAALALGIYEDFALPLSGVVASLIILMRDHGVTPTQHPPRPVTM
jgi:hypothetical protein